MKEKKNACTGCAAAEAGRRFVRHPESADGEAVVTAYPVFPGIEIAYCDIHAHECRLEHTPEAPLMRISHCREGRLEQQMGNEYYFLAPGDLAVSRSDASDGAARFPTGHYHGITVTIDPGASAGVSFVPALGRERPPRGADGKVLRERRLFCRPLVRERGAYFFGAVLRTGGDPQGVF